LSNASFRFARMLRVRMENCQLDDTDFSSAKIRDLEMQRCHLESTDFTNAHVISADLRSSNIISVNGVAGLAHATVDTLQAAALATSLATAVGIVVAPADIQSIRPGSDVLVDEVAEVAERPSADEARVHLAELRESLTHHAPVQAATSSPVE
jgi:Na+(H+)/acetate symporter ActP